MRRTWFLGLVFGMNLLGASAASAGTPSWQTLSVAMNSSKKPALTRGIQNGIEKIQAYALDSGGAIVNFNITAATRALTTTALGGLTQKAPTAIEWTNHRQVLVVGNDNASIWRNISNSEAPFAGWQPVLGTPPGTTICSDPTAASWGTNRIDLYVVGCDGTLRHAWTGNNSSWAWDNRGAPSVSGLATDPGPQVVSPGSGRLDVWVKDAWGVLWDNQYASSTFTWRQTDIPAVTDIAAAPTTVVPGGGSIDTTVAIGILRRTTNWRFNATAGNVAGVSTQPGWPMHDAEVLTTRGFTAVTLYKSSTRQTTMYGLEGGRVIRMQLECNVDQPTSYTWSSPSDGQELFASGKILNGKIAAVRGFHGGQNSSFVFGFEGASLVYVGDFSSTFILFP